MKRNAQYTQIMKHMKMMLREKSIVLSAYIKNPEKSHTSSLKTYLEALNQKEARELKISREITKLEAEINKMETKRTIQRISETRSWLSEKTKKMGKPFQTISMKTVTTKEVYLLLGFCCLEDGGGSCL